jgi:hypothetical protein
VDDPVPHGRDRPVPQAREHLADRRAVVGDRRAGLADPLDHPAIDHRLSIEQPVLERG